MLFVRRITLTFERSHLSGLLYPKNIRLLKSDAAFDIKVYLVGVVERPVEDRLWSVTPPKDD